MIKLQDTVAYDLRELSRKLGVSERTLRRYIRLERLQAFKLGFHRSICPSSAGVVEGSSGSNGTPSATDVRLTPLSILYYPYILAGKVRYKIHGTVLPGRDVYGGVLKQLGAIRGGHDRTAIVQLIASIVKDR